MSIPISALPAKYQNQVAAQMTAKALPLAQKPLIRQEAGPALNKLETAFLGHLKARDGAVEVWSQSLKLKLANGCWYCPDFIVAGYDSTWDAYEVKGFMRDDAAVKLKVAAHQYPEFRFFLATRLKGAWKIDRVFP